MQIRKRSVFALTALAFSFGLAGFSLAIAGDDDSPLHKSMEQVNAKNIFIVKNLKTPANFKKNQKEIAESAKALATLGKSVRDETEPAKEAKKSQKLWTDLMDAYVTEADLFATEVVKPDMTQAEAKKKFSAVAGTCTACHKEFRKDN